MKDLVYFYKAWGVQRNFANRAKITGNKVDGMLGKRIPPYAKIQLTIGDSKFLTGGSKCK